MRYVSDINYDGISVPRFDLRLGQWDSMLDDDANIIITITDSDTGGTEKFSFYKDFYSDFSGVVGIEAVDSSLICVYATSKQALLLRDQIDFIEDSTDIPLELLSAKDCEWHNSNTPANKVVTETDTLLFTSGVIVNESGLTKHLGESLPESIILSYIKLLYTPSVNTEDWVYKDIPIVTRIDCIDSEVTYRIRNNALIQSLGYPLVIDEFGNIYLGYTYGTVYRSGLNGVLKYKVKDMRRFKIFLAKLTMLSKEVV